MRYALVTPVRDEAANLRRLGEALLAQTLPPQAWIVVDNGSTDESRDVAAELGRRADWVRLLTVPGEERPRPGTPIVRAFKAGLAALDEIPEVVVKLDADISFEPTYFEQLLAEFGRRPRLGIASGVCLEQNPEGEWVQTRVTGDHARGAVRAYRRECLDEVGPLEERMGWDVVDQLRAVVLGWEAGLLQHLAFYHHRRVGERDGGGRRRWQALGESSYYMGYRWSYLVLRALHHAPRDPAALALLTSFAAAAVRRRPRLDDPAVVAHLRNEQRLRNLRGRVRAAKSPPPVASSTG
jgi:biofilm PGA synthesis N-glycosyltransferase PgaC